MHDEQGAIQAAKAAGGEGQHSRAQLTQPTAPHLLGCAAKDRHGGGPAAKPVGGKQMLLQRVSAKA